MGRNAAIKHFSPTAGQPIELFDSKRARMPVIVEILASPWIRRASQLECRDGAYAVKRAEEAVDVVWDAERQRPASFARAAAGATPADVALRTYCIDAIAQVWVAERVWWDPRRRVSRQFWRVMAEGGVYDLVYDRQRKGWLLVGIQD